MVDATGQPTQTWTDVVTVFAKRTNTISASMQAVAQGVDTSRRQVRFDMHPRAIDLAWRIVHDGLVYQIITVGTNNENDMTSIVAVSTGETP